MSKSLSLEVVSPIFQSEIVSVKISCLITLWVVMLFVIVMVVVVVGTKNLEIFLSFFLIPHCKIPAYLQ